MRKPEFDLGWSDSKAWALPVSDEIISNIFKFGSVQESSQRRGIKSYFQRITQIAKKKNPQYHYFNGLQELQV